MSEKRGVKKQVEKRDKVYLVKCLQEEKDFIDTVTRKHGYKPTTFMRDAALEKAKRLYAKEKKSYIAEALEVLREIEK